MTRRTYRTAATVQPTAVEQRALDLMFNSGRRARQAGIAIKDCPFAKGSPAAREWKSGWRSVGTETAVTEIGF